MRQPDMAFCFILGVQPPAKKLIYFNPRKAAKVDA
jgi:hypothetical protein